MKKNRNPRNREGDAKKSEVAKNRMTLSLCVREMVNLQDYNKDKSRYIRSDLTLTIFVPQEALVIISALAEKFS